MSEIADQQLQHKIDVMIGGGKLWYAPLASKVYTKISFFLEISI